MTESSDPLLPHLLNELDGMRSIRSQIVVPTTVLADDGTPIQTVSWRYRYTWQEVERSRRYVIPLTTESRKAAQSRAAFKINQLALDAILHDDRVPRLGIDVLPEQMDERVAKANLGGATHVGMVEIEEGIKVYWLRHEDVISIPVSDVRRQVTFRDDLSVYQIVESIDVGDVQLLEPGLAWVQAGEAPDR